MVTLKCALLILDAQNGFVQAGSFTREIDQIIKLAEHFKNKGLPIYLTQHRDPSDSSLIPVNTEKSAIDSRIASYSNMILTKEQPSAFKDNMLDRWLQEQEVSELVITGFNVEYCCLFNAIIAHEKGYSVTFIEDACATVNSDTTYEMPGLDIRDFISTILHWSGTINVVDTHEYL